MHEPPLAGRLAIMTYPTDPARWPELARAALFGGLSPSLVETLASAHRVSAPDVTSRWSQIFPIEPSGSQPSGYWWKLTSKPARVRGFMESASMAGDERPSVLLVRSSFTEPESDKPQWVKDARLGFLVPWRGGRPVIAHLASKRYGHMALVSEDGAWGFAVSSYVGYLPKEYDDYEIVYRVARWRPHG